MLTNNTKQDTVKIPLSLRMQGILDMLRDEKATHGTIGCVADIGCDHAFVSMACIEQKLARHVIAMDVRRGPLDIAQKNLMEYGFEKSVETRLSNGFDSLQVGEADWAVIAGMGGKLMRDILVAGHIHLEAGIGLILQPQSELDVLRLCLEEHGYQICNEHFLLEEGKYYTIIKAKKQTTDIHMTRAELLYGPVLIREKNVLLDRFLTREVEKKCQIYQTLQGSQTDSAKKRREELEQEIGLLHNIIDTLNRR